METAPDETKKIVNKMQTREYKEILAIRKKRDVK